MERYSENRERIISAARELAQELGYSAINMVAVATRSGVGRATLYRYFANKEHLYAAVILRWGQQFQERLERQELRGRSVGSRVAKALELLVEEARQNPNLIAAQVAGSVSGEPNVIALHGEISTLMPGILKVALKGHRAKNFNLTCRTLEHMTQGNFTLMNAGKLQPTEASRELVQVAEILLQDIWQKP